MILIVSKIYSMIALVTHISLLTPSLNTMKITMSFLLPASSVAFSFHPSAGIRTAVHHRVFDDFWKSPGLMGRRDRRFIFSGNGSLQSSLRDDKANVVDDQNSPSSTVENTTTFAASEASSSSPPSPSSSWSSSSSSSAAAGIDESVPVDVPINVSPNGLGAGESHSSGGRQTRENEEGQDERRTKGKGPRWWRTSNPRAREVGRRAGARWRRRRGRAAIPKDGIRCRDRR
mmetsp:Transcript_1025/g.2129  ORF Transcript_1025/g.2129 Transcript_1025/m.2129 type:complete len:231 (-) Transcript_1025:103-795(-)